MDMWIFTAKAKIKTSLKEIAHGILRFTGIFVHWSSIAFRIKTTT